ncbi:MAG: OadG family transporter subunit [Bacteroidales bacterium]|nr:OadG family transporter subunit [Bacteroidales bacterium]MDD6140749.1 OadG family transporter subunit [Bacteroidales bacterium]MDD6622166.1 OadG family transporter subunit [Bacteroidales bacterium]MDD6670153.1 OadG family transporter subunit [Bacteroidales bacterium]
MNKKIIVLLLCAVASTAAVFAQGRKAVRINEVMVQNDSNYVDDYGQYHAWIELFNSSFAPVETSCMYLTNDKNNPKMYPVPRMDVNTEIPPRQHLLFWADGEPNRGTFHISFTLTPGKENWIGLYDADGITLIDEVTIPANLPANQSYARKEDGIRNDADDAQAWEIRDGGVKYITPSSNNVIIDANEKIEMFAEHDRNGFGMTVLAMGVVFSALLILSICFRSIGKVNEKIAKRKKAESHNGPVVASDVKSTNADSGEEIAAIVMALHEHLNMHDHEDFVLTINKVKRAYSPWNSKIYSLRQTPHK